MTYEFNASDAAIEPVANPFKAENILLGLASATLIAGGTFVLLAARHQFALKHDKVALVTLALATILLGSAIKFLIQALSQIRFYLGRKYPIGLADEMAQAQVGLADGAKELVEVLRHRAVDFPEPRGALNGLLYSLIPKLITAPPPIQVAAVRNFQTTISSIAILASMAAAYLTSKGGDYEGMISWLYLPISGLSLASPFLQRQAFDADESEVDGNSNAVLWKLISLLTLSIVAPVAIPRYMPVVHIAPLWIAPAAMLATAVVASALFLASLVAQLDVVHETAVSCEQTTISMNCHPGQLWPKLSRDMQTSWAHGIPNRIYANVPPGAADVERGSFQGYLLEETQPSASFNLASANAREALGGAHVAYLVLLGTWALILSGAAAAVGALYAPDFSNMERFEISRVILIVIALGLSSNLAFRIGHLLWSRMYFKSRLMFVVVDGTYQTGEMRIGNQFTSNVQSRATVTRVEDATLRVWVSDLVTVAFGKEGKRFIMGMAPADGFTKALADDLKMFAVEQSSVTAPTSSRDVQKAQAIAQLDAAMNIDRSKQLPHPLSGAMSEWRA